MGRFAFSVVTERPCLTLSLARRLAAALRILPALALGACNSLPTADAGPPPPASPTQVHQGTAPFMLDGQRFFPIGVAGAPLDLLGDPSGGTRNFDRMFADLAAAGMNVFYPQFLTSETGNTSAEAVFDFIPDTCESRRNDPAGGIAALHRHRLAVIFPAFIVVEKTGNLLRDKQLDERFAAQRLETVERCYAGLPFLAYHSYDDAPVYQGEGIPIRKLRQIKRLVEAGRRDGTPYVLVVHPTEESLGYVTHKDLKRHLESKLRDNLPMYSSGDLADAVGVYTYPIPFASPATVGPAVDRFRALQPARIRPLVVLQGLGMADAKLHPTARRPTAQETRFMAFQAIVHGAGGIMWWGANFIPAASETWMAIKRTAREIRQVSRWLVGPDSRLRVNASGIEILLKPPVAAGEPHLLIAVNPTAVPQTAEVSLPAPAAFRTVRRLRDQRSVPLGAGRFTERLEGYGVQVYEVTVGEAPSAGPRR